MLGLSLWHLTLKVHRNPHPQSQTLSYLCHLRAPDCTQARKIGTEFWQGVKAWPARRACVCQIKTELNWVLKLCFFDISSLLLAEIKDFNSNTGATALVVPSFVLQAWSVDVSPWRLLEQHDWAIFLQLENIPVQSRYCNNLLNCLARRKMGKWSSPEIVVSQVSVLAAAAKSKTFPVMLEGLSISTLTVQYLLWLFQ